MCDNFEMVIHWNEVSDEESYQDETQMRTRGKRVVVTTMFTAKRLISKRPRDNSVDRFKTGNYFK